MNEILETPRTSVELAGWELVHASPDAELFCLPSPEAARLAGRFPGVFAPRDGRGSRASVWLRALVVAPFTQFTFASFDLQMFLLDVLHTSWIARAGHLVGMTGVNLIVMAVLAASLGPGFALGYGVVLLLWYAVVAREVGLLGWWLTMLALVTALEAGALGLASIATTGQLLLAGLVCAAVVTFPHAAEPKMPPRAGHPQEWRSVREVVFGTAAAPHGLGKVLRNGFRVAMYPWIGLVNELWASPRLMPYNVLRVLLRCGYEPALKQKLDARRDRAWATGNPALDYVGVGGGTFIRPIASPTATNATR
jgi:hypothetical protein